MENKTLVLLHGWGCDSRIWSPILPQLQKLTHVIAIDLPGFGNSPAIENFTLDSVVDLIAAQLPDKCVLMGWSLGGMLAIQIAARYSHKVSRIITLATNVKFVATPDNLAAMPLTTNQEFNNSFLVDASASLKLFSGLLVQGDINERPLLKKIRGLITTENINDNWHQALTLLSQLDNRVAFSALTQPGLHLLGEADMLVPVGVASVLSALNQQQKIIVFPQTAHALHWSQPEKVVVAIANYCFASAVIDKRRIAKSFSRAARTYDTVANLQRDVGTALLKIIEPDTAAEVVVDIGCGTGFFTQHIQQKFSQAKIVGLDLAEGMLTVAREKNPAVTTWLCGDAENLPLATASVDAIFSSLTLQWCHDLPVLFSELNRVLKPGGALFFSTLGPDTLHELKNAWQQVDDGIHVNRFKPHQQVCESLQENGFSIAKCIQQVSALAFEKLSDLTHSLKALGAHNINRGQAEGLTGRNKIAALKAAYEKYRSNNLLPATYDVIYIKAQK